MVGVQWLHPSARLASRWAMTVVVGVVLGCGGRREPIDPLAVIAAELDSAVARGDATTVRGYLAHATPEVRAIAIQAAAAGGDWDSMPTLIDLLDDDDTGVRARAFAACAALLGMDHGHDPRATATDLARAKDSVRRAYETMRQNPPPQYRH